MRAREDCVRAHQHMQLLVRALRHTIRVHSGKNPVVGT